MLDNMSLKGKLFSLVAVFIVSLIGFAIYLSIALDGQDKAFHKAQEVTKVRGAVVAASTGGLQITSAIRGIYIDPNDTGTM